MKKLCIVITTVLEKEQSDPFNLIVVKKNYFAVTVGKFYYINDIILNVIEVTLNSVQNKISLKMIAAWSMSL